MEKRLFCAIKIEPSQSIIDCMDELKDVFRFDKIKWVAPENIHLTLKFLGETNVELIPKINNLISETASISSRFQLEVKGLGAFSRNQKPSVIWLGLNFEHELLQIFQQLEKGFESLGFPKENRKFSPHLTIGRVKYIEEPSELDEIVSDYKKTVFLKKQIEKITLYESVLRPQGPIYKALDEFYLQKV